MSIFKLRGLQAASQGDGSGRLGRLFALCALVFLTALPAGAAVSVQPFTRTGWTDLQQAESGRAVVVFSSTDCAHCPGVIRTLAGEIARAGRPVRLHVVVLDGAGQEAHLQDDPVYRLAHRLHVVTDEELPVRHAVNPAWHGLTPYVVFLVPGRTPAYHLGLPPATVRQRFFRP